MVMNNAIPLPLVSAMLANPQASALQTRARSWSYGQLAQAAGRVARVLEGRGVQAGEEVVLVGNADARFVVGLHALGWLGAAAAPLSVRLTADETTAALGVLGAKRALVTGAVEPSVMAALERQVEVIRLEIPGDGPQADERFWPLDETRLVVMTSGTTGTPSVVRLTTLQLMTSAFGSAIRLGHLPGDAWLNCLPLNHVGGLSILFRCAFYATEVVLHERFEADKVARALDEGRVSLVSLVPQMLQRVLDARQSQGPLHQRVRCVLLGGAAAPEALLERCASLSVPVSVTWGMSEAASQVCTRAPGQFGAAEGCGAPLAFARVDVVDGSRLRVRGPVVTDGLLLTGDGGHIDAHGRVHVAGRVDDVIISGGENISPVEVEAVLERHSAVAEAAVVAIEDETWGQRPAAVLVMAPSASGRPLEAELEAWCRQHLTPFKVPRRFWWAQSLPKGRLGKLLRRQIRAQITTSSEAEDNYSTISSWGGHPKEDAG